MIHNDIYQVISYIFSFLSTLKLSWLKRLVTNDSTYSLWISLYPTLQNLNKFGFDFIKTCYTNVDNPFWFDVFKHYKKLYDTKRQESLEIKDVYGEPIHFNTNIKRGKKVIFVKEWELHGILQTKDLMDENHRFLDFIAFKAKYNVTKTNFMLYFGIISYTSS